MGAVASLPTRKLRTRTRWNSRARVRTGLQAENSGEAPARAVTLNLHGKSIGSMDGLSPCVKLRQLDLSFNQVERIQGCDEPLSLGSAAAAARDAPPQRNARTI